MLAYWILFLFPVSIAFLPVRADFHLKSLAFLLFLFIVASMIGFRFEVGGDWSSYLSYLELVSGIGFLEAIVLSDPGWVVINWVSVKAGLGIVGVNLIGGIIYLFGLIRFCRAQPLPWIGLIVATPYLLIVVGMGYQRQAVALGFVFWALSTWNEKNFLKFSSLIMVAVLFHKSAIIMLLFAIFINKSYVVHRFLLIATIFAIGTLFLMQAGTIQIIYSAYVTAQYMQSDGALTRILMNVLPTIIFFLYYKKFSQFEDIKLWQIIGILSILSLFTVSFISTLTDRFAFYLCSIQIAVFSRLPLCMVNKYWHDLCILAIIAYYTLVLFVWLNFAKHAEYWVPYSAKFF